ncbi:MAG: sodium-translocating pyrophosphatase [Candidatus Aenigmatarchaeota archaeon]
MIIPFIVSLVAILFALLLVFNLMKKDAGSEKMKNISLRRQRGAKTFMKIEYKILFDISILIFLAIFFVLGWPFAISFAVGALFSALAAALGMLVSTSSNARTAQACKLSQEHGLRLAFSSGAVMSMSVVGLGLLGVTILYYIFNSAAILYAFGFGASFVALFARVGGGIFTKSADIGADLVGKIEKHIHEDDPRNPGVIADNVGDNVGDVAGMGADLFESYVESMIAAIAIAALASFTVSMVLTQFVLMLAAAGIISSIIGFVFVRNHMFEGLFVSTIMMIILSMVLNVFYFQDFNVFFSVLAGLLAGTAIGLSTDYYTSSKFMPTRKIAKAARSGAAPNIIKGLSIGMQSTAVPVLVVCAAIIASYHFAGLFGIAIAAVGMLSTLGFSLAMTAYSPVADNAASIAEQSKMSRTVYKRASNLDALGNTTAAIGKGFAIGSAALTALALFAVYAQSVKLDIINIINPYSIVGLLIGALLPFIFSSMTMGSVAETAEKIVSEIRHQFKHHKLDYDKPIEICTKASLNKMIAPALIAIIAPLAVGFVLGVEALGAMLAGAISTGFLLAVTMANAGGAWDNAKKYIESGKFGGVGSQAHMASVVGDTVGDPCKDTAGPSLNILIKLMSIISLLFAALFV